MLDQVNGGPALSTALLMSVNSLSSTTGDSQRSDQCNDKKMQSITLFILLNYQFYRNKFVPSGILSDLTTSLI
jgi:hypothetical protein